MWMIEMHRFLFVSSGFKQIGISSIWNKVEMLSSEIICGRCCQCCRREPSVLHNRPLYAHQPRIHCPRRRVCERALLVTILVCASSLCILRIISNGEDFTLFLPPDRRHGNEVANTSVMSLYEQNNDALRFSKLNCTSMDRMFNAYLQRSRKKIIHQLVQPKQKKQAKMIGDNRMVNEHLRNVTLEEILLQLKLYPPKLFTDETPPWDINPLGKLLRSKGSIFGGRTFKTCACVSSSGLLAGRKLGKFIDSHDAVLRMNIAPVVGFEEDVGSKTTIRMVNNEMLRWMNEPLLFPQFRAWEFPDSLNATLVAWESCTKRGPLTNCLENPEWENVTKNGGESMQPMFSWLRRNPEREFYFLHTDWLWSLLDLLRWHSPGTVHDGVPSTGFLGFAFLMHFCETVRAFEMIPSMDFDFNDKELRYYFDDNAYESFANYVDNYHPKGAEILLLLALNVGSLNEVFGDGYATIPGLITANEAKPANISSRAANNGTD